MKTLFNPFYGFDSETHSLIDSLVEVNQENNLDFFKKKLIELKYSYILEGQLYFNAYASQVFKSENTSFKAWIKECFSSTWGKVLKVVCASKIGQFLLSQGHEKLPLNETQAYTLNLLDNEDIVNSDESSWYDRVLLVWDEVINFVGDDTSKITCKLIKDFIRKFYPEYLPQARYSMTRIPSECDEKLNKLSKFHGHDAPEATVKYLIEKEYLEVFSGDKPLNATEKIELKIKEENWKKDLENLIQPIDKQLITWVASQWNFEDKTLEEKKDIAEKMLLANGDKAKSWIEKYNRHLEVKVTRDESQQQFIDKQREMYNSEVSPVVKQKFAEIVEKMKMTRLTR